MTLSGKHILLIISGGIAAYKMNHVVRELGRAGAEVKVVMTPSARHFIAPLTISTLAKSEVLTDFYTENGSWNNHVELALWADLIVVAPCTANTLAKMVHGQCDNLALAVYMSAKCPVFIAPAMDLDMYAHPSTQQNLELAEDYGHTIIPVGVGELASGLHGPGRLAEPEVIVEAVKKHFTDSLTLTGKKILITAGPTYEAIDPVRFIGNHSSGKMGFLIAEEAAARGAEIVLISGPTSQQLCHPAVQVVRVTSAREMYDAVFRYYDKVDIAIAAAAVADYAPKEVASEKIKKNDDSITIELVKNPDILKAMGANKKQQFLAGFALETQNEEANARQKLQKKNLDMIVLNSLRDEGAGFRSDTNKIKILTKDAEKEFPLKAKAQVAADILDFIEAKI